MASSTSLQVAGLASNFDWKVFVDQIIAIERTPAARLEAEQAANTQKASLLGTLGSKLAALQTATQALEADDLHAERASRSTASSAGWSTSADTGAATGSYAFAVTQVATAAVRQGAGNAGLGLAVTGDVSGVTLATAPLALPVTEGSFSINGRQVSVALTDSLQDVLDAINLATEGDITGTYDPVADAISLVSATGEIVLGAANDSSNFLRAVKLSNNGTDTVTSAGGLGVVKTSSAVASARLAAAVTAVDGSGNGSFVINGVEIAYNVNEDSVAAVLTRINQAGAGVTAGYDAVNDRFLLTNDRTGDLGLAVSESSGGLLGALGLTDGATFSRGADARFTVNSGPELSSASNTLTDGEHGVTGLSVTVAGVGTQTIEVTASTARLRAEIEDFVESFNAVQSYLGEITKVTTDGKGKVTAAALASNREIQDWGRSLRTLAFSAVTSPGGSISRIEQLGLDFNSSGQLEIKDGARLDAALADDATDVAGFFRTGTTGFVARLDTFLGTILEQNSDQQERLNRVNSGIDDQIANIERLLEQRRALMESAFIQMENIQSNLKSQQSTLERAFATKTE